MVDFSHFLPQVNKGIPHPAQGGIDAYAGFIGNLLKAHVHIMAHHEHLLLLYRQLLDKIAEPGLGFLGYL